MNRPEVSPAERRAAHELEDWIYEVDLNVQYNSPWHRNIGVSDHYPTIRLAQSARKFSVEILNFVISSNRKFTPYGKNTDYYEI